jgi:hypothetical protein
MIKTLLLVGASSLALSATGAEAAIYLGPSVNGYAPVWSLPPIQILPIPVGVAQGGGAGAYAGASGAGSYGGSNPGGSYAAPPPSPPASYYGVSPGGGYSGPGPGGVYGSPPYGAAGPYVTGPAPYSPGYYYAGSGGQGGQTYGGVGYAGGVYGSGPGPVFQPTYLMAPGRVLDDVLGSPVPEPSAWALMLGGFGFLGYVLRRRLSRRARADHARAMEV